MESIIKKIFEEEIIPSVKTGKVYIKEYDPYIKEEVIFTYNIRYDVGVTKDLMMPVLTIHEEEQFYQLLEEYVMEMMNTYPIDETIITQHEYMKKIMATVFNNATYDDFLNPEQYLKKRIAFLESGKKWMQEPSVSYFLDHDNLCCETKIEKQGVMLETPYRFSSSIKKNQLEYELPNISFGIQDQTCYIYNIQEGKHHKKAEEIEQIIKTNFKKVPVNEEEYHSYYRNKLRNVTPSFLMTMALFLKYIYDHGIEDVQVVPYLPIRYQAKKEAHQVITKQKAHSKEEELELLQQLEEKQKRIQENITDKFLRLFERLEVMTDMVEITLQPFEYDDMMHIVLHPFTKAYPPMLEELLENRPDITKLL